MDERVGLGLLITNYSLRYLPDHFTHDQDYPELSPAARSLLKRLVDPNCSCLQLWSEATLRRLVLEDRVYLRRELINRHGKIEEDSSDQQLLFDYFGQEPTRERLIDYLEEMVSLERELNPVGLELPLSSLASGVFYIPGYHRQEDEDWIPVKGNFHLLAEEDLAFLAQLYGLTGIKDLGLLESLIVAEQNNLACELLTKGYIVRREGGYSLVEMIIQQKLQE